MNGSIERVCISVNSECNLNCRYCYFFARQEELPGAEALSVEELGIILERIHDHASRPESVKRIKVNFVGSGEPLIHWPLIRSALTNFIQRNPSHRLRFYTVTNGTLLTPEVVREMISLDIFPSVSLDGPARIHDSIRVDGAGRGTHEAVLQGVRHIQDAGLPVCINTTMSRQVLENLDEYFAFIAEQRIDKVIFDRLCDVPDEHAVTSTDFYQALRSAAELKKRMGLDTLEIGNLEAWRRALSQETDRVCTMFGSTCGAGFHNLIYLQREVFPCGRLFHQKQWTLGSFEQPLEHFREKMAQLVGISKVDEPFLLGNRDCLIDSGTGNDPARQAFASWFSRQLNEDI